MVCPKLMVAPTPPSITIDPGTVTFVFQDSTGNFTSEACPVDPKADADSPLYFKLKCTVSNVGGTSGTVNIKFSVLDEAAENKICISVENVTIPGNTYGQAVVSTNVGQITVPGSYTAQAEITTDTTCPPTVESPPMPQY